MISAQDLSMPSRLRYPVTLSQRHSVTVFRKHSPMNSFGSRVRALRERRQIKPKDLASLTGIAYSTLKDIENERQHSTTKLPNLVRALQTSAKYLESGKGDPDERDYGDGDEGFASIAGYAQAIGLGAGPEAQEYAETHKLKFRADSLARKRLNPSKLAVMYGDGESMEPRIRKGDAILFDTSDTLPRDGQLYVIMVPGAGGSEYQVKRCEVLDDIVFFRADNPTGDHNWIKARRMDSPRNPIKVIGRVRWIGSWEG